MKVFRHRALVVALLLGGLVPALAGTAAADPAPDDPRQEQSVEFTSTAPVGLVWSSRANSLGDYRPTATSTSGLPVHFSVDPASTGCSGGPGLPGPDGQGRFTVWAAAQPGTCIVHADQPGDEEFRPAARQTQTFEVLREQVFLGGSKVGKGLLGLIPTTFRAELQRIGDFGPGWTFVGYPGQTLTFSVAGKVMCSGVTVEQIGDAPFESTAVATCKATIGLATALSATSYTVTYAGNTLSLGATATGKLS